jgi:hypothetical protein
MERCVEWQVENQKDGIRDKVLPGMVIIEIRNSKHEIRSKFECPKFKIQNDLPCGSTQYNLV